MQWPMLLTLALLLTGCRKDNDKLSGHHHHGKDTQTAPHPDLMVDPAPEPIHARLVHIRSALHRPGAGHELGTWAASRTHRLKSSSGPTARRGHRDLETAHEYSLPADVNSPYTISEPTLRPRHQRALSSHPIRATHLSTAPHRHKVAPRTVQALRKTHRRY
jgi:hypothetical protein